MTTSERNWVWFSDKDSRAAGKVSVLAVIETVAAVAFYWWLAFQIDTAFMLIVSPVVAFLVLLRSPQSVEEGVWYLEDHLKKDGLTRTQFFVTWVIIICVIIALFYTYLTLRSAYHHEMSLFWHAPLLVILGLNLGMALAVLKFGVDAIDALGDDNNGKASEIALYFVVTAVPAGYFARALVIRFRATAKFFPAGLHNFPQNWYHLNLRQDLLTPPDLVPGLPDDHLLSFSSMMKVRSSSVFEKAVKLLIFLFCFLPTIFYRITIKSTAWLYLPVIWMAHIPSKLREDDKKEVWVKTAGRGWLTLISAVSVLVYALYLSFDPQTFRAMQAANENQMFTPAHLIWAIDPASLKLWFWITLPSALLTILLWFWVNKIRTNIEAGGHLSWHSTQMRCLIALNQIKNALIIAWMLMTLLSVARAGWLLGKLPDWMEPLFTNAILPITNLWSS